MSFAHGPLRPEFRFPNGLYFSLDGVYLCCHVNSEFALALFEIFITCFTE